MRKSFFKKQNKAKPIIMNEQIRVSRVQVIDEKGDNLGSLDTYKAIQIAKEKGLDLVEIAPTAKPPVCKIIDSGKYKYQQSKKEQQKKTKQKKVETKGIRIGLVTSSHDLEYKAKNTEKFLTAGNKVKIEIKLRGREKAHAEAAKKKLKAFLQLVTVKYKIEEEPKRNPIGLIMTIGKL